MPCAILADLVLLVHALFVLFVLLGGFVVLLRPRLAVYHLPAVVWGVVIEVGGCVCPLTYLENHFRRLAGESGYGGTFVGNCLERILYPLDLSKQFQVLLGLLILFINLTIYLHIWRKRRG
jgi:hypothetical protein